MTAYLLTLMWFAVVPLTIEAIEAPPSMETSGTALERLWREASAPYRALSLGAFLRGFGLVLVNCALAAVSVLASTVGVLAIGEANSDIAVLAVIGPCVGLLLALVLLRLSVALPVMIMENVAVGQSLRRSWHITKSQVFRLLGLSILTTVAVLVPSLLLDSVGIALGLLSDASSDGGSVVNRFALFLGQTIGLILAAPITSASYYYLRQN